MTHRTILVVDDSVDDRRLVLRYLRRDPGCDYRVEEATSGEEGLEAVERLRPDVLVLDYHLGAISWLEVLKTLRERGQRELAVVFLTGSHRDGADPLVLGADDYIDKDELTESQLRRVIDNAVVKARSRAALERSQAELREALDEVTRRMEFERRLLAVVSHDLRSPLQSLGLGIASLAAEAELSETGRYTVSLLQRSTDHMVQMVEQLLDLKRIEQTGRFPINPAPGDFGELARARIEELRSAYPKREILFECRGDTRGSFDPVALGQLLHNLDGNAIVHGSAHSPVRVLLEGEQLGLEIRVINHGSPIPPELRKTLFEPFARGKQSRRGLGLGLFISRELVIAHGGTIDVSSDDLQTMIRVALPRHPQEIDRQVEDLGA